MNPYYQDNSVTIYHGDCREILPTLEPVDLVLTDPPYPDWLTEEYQFDPSLLLTLKITQGFVFWSAKTNFPLPYTAIHIWDKKTGAASEYERIFEIGGQSNFKVFRHYLLNSTVAANYCGDVFWNHPSQKPIKLMRELVQRMKGRTILDPFMGSGTTLRAAKDLGRRAIGIEIEEKYCEIAAKRMAQEVLDLCP